MTRNLSSSESRAAVPPSKQNGIMPHKPETGGRSAMDSVVVW